MFDNNVLLTDDGNADGLPIVATVTLSVFGALVPFIIGMLIYARRYVCLATGSVFFIVS